MNTKHLATLLPRQWGIRVLFVPYAELQCSQPRTVTSSTPMISTYRTCHLTCLRFHSLIARTIRQSYRSYSVTSTVPPEHGYRSTSPKARFLVSCWDIGQILRPPVHRMRRAFRCRFALLLRGR